MVGKRVKSWPDTVIVYHYIDRKYFVNEPVFPRHLWSCFVFVTCSRGNWWKYEHHCVEWTSRHTKHEQQKSPPSVKPHATIISTCTQSNHGVICPPGTRPSTPRWSCMMWTSLHQCSLVADLVLKPKCRCEIRWCKWGNLTSGHQVHWILKTNAIVDSIHAGQPQWIETLWGDPEICWENMISQVPNFETLSRYGRDTTCATA